MSDDPDQTKTGSQFSAAILGGNVFKERYARTIRLNALRRKERLRSVNMARKRVLGRILNREKGNPDLRVID